MEKRFFSIGEAALFLGVSVSTMRRWEAAGSLCADFRTVGGHRRYSVSCLQKLLPKCEKLTVGYARVSANDQRNDLERQEKRINQYLSTISTEYRVITDLGSGINYRKKGLRKLIKLIVNEQVEKLVITDKDRLLRFGAELIFEICKHYGIEIIVLNEDETPDSFEVSLAKDVITIVTVFSARLYGKRSGKNKRLLQQVT